jgi:hypothetical protein
MTPGMRLLIAAGPASREVRVLSQEALMRGTSRLVWDSTCKAAPADSACNVLPVGSVEFVLAAMSVFGMDVPRPIGFPAALERFLFRRVTESTVGDLDLLFKSRPSLFIKPRDAVKTFTGFVLQAVAATVPDEFEQEQLDVVSKLSPSAQLWISDVVSWQSEWRYYVMHGKIIGCGRYDPDGEEDAPAPSQTVVLEAVGAFEASGFAPASYSLDFGVLGTGETALVEANDGWALGYYTGSLTPSLYMAMLDARWQEMATIGALSPAPLG